MPNILMGDVDVQEYNFGLLDVFENYRVGFTHVSSCLQMDIATSSYPFAS